MLAGIPADRLAVALEDLELVPDGGLIAEEVAGVGVPGHQRERASLAAAADEDRDALATKRPGNVESLPDPVVAAAEAGGLLDEHGTADLQRLLQAVDPLPHGRVLEPVAGMLVLVPSRADPKDRPPAGDDVQGGDLLGEQGGVAVGHAGDHRAEADLARPRGDPAEQRVGLEHRVCPRADVCDLVEVIHHPHRVEARLLGRSGDVGDPLEEIAVGDSSVGEARDLKAEAGDAHHVPFVAEGCSMVRRR